MLIRVSRVAVLVAIAVTCCAVHAQERIRFLANAHTSATTLTLGDVAELNGFSADWRARLQNLAVARVAPYPGNIQLRVADLAIRARAQVPALGPSLSFQEGQTIELRVDAPVQAKADVSSNTPAAGCWRTVNEIERGETLRRKDVEPAPCAAIGRDDGVRYDRLEHVVRAGDRLPIQSPLGAIPESLFAGVGRGDLIDAQYRFGHIAVSRKVTAVQDAAFGHAVFVTTATGDLLSAGLPKETR
jgi:hypothetical protein